MRIATAGVRTGFAMTWFIMGESHLVGGGLCPCKEEGMYRILLVEDDLALAGAVRSYLEIYGHEVFCVSDFMDVVG